MGWSHPFFQYGGENEKIEVFGSFACWSYTDVRFR
jgi:hypothetical protein